MIGFSVLFAEPAPARAGSPGPLAPDEIPSSDCEECGARLDERARAGFCPSCADRRRARYCAGYYAGTARNGQVVDETETAPFAHLLPAALARKGLHIEREGLAWVVRR